MAQTMFAGRPARAGAGLRWVVMVMLLAAGAMLTLSAWAQGRDGGPMGGGMFGGPPERMGQRIDHMLDGLNATDAQRAQIKQIALAAGNDLRGQREAGRALRERAAAVFAAPTVDANAAEQVRQQMLAQHDQASRRTLAAMLDVSRVLSPEQRAKLAERMKQRGAMMHERMQRMEREGPRS
jgi:protein CpxP